MEVTTADAPKRGRAKAATPVATPKPAAKVTRRSSAKMAAPAPMIIAVQSVNLTDMIATTAYFLAAERQFMPGHELDDWLEAERRVQAMLNS